MYGLDGFKFPNRKLIEGSYYMPPTPVDAVP
jgi:hypothetical protein